MSLLARRAMFGKAGRLPGMYQEVEYLAADENQYIDTGYAVQNPEHKYEIKYLKNKLSTHAYGVDFYGNATRHMMGQVYSNNFYIGNGTGGPSITTPECVQKAGTIYEGSVTVTGTTWDTQKAVLELNGGSQEFFQKSTSRFFSGCPADVTAFLFAVRQAGNEPRFLMNGRIYYLRMYDNTGLKVRDFIPCYRKSDRKPGMYDLVEGKFYTNIGTGEFTMGPEIK